MKITNPKSIPVWTLEMKDSRKAEILKNALRNVLDPEMGYSVIDLGMIRNAEINRDEVLEVTMILTTLFCPYAQKLSDQVKHQAEEALQIETNVVFGDDPWGAEMIEAGIDPNFDG